MSWLGFPKRDQQGTEDQSAKGVCVWLSQGLEVGGQAGGGGRRSGHTVGALPTWGPLGFFLFGLETTGAGSTWDFCDPGLFTAPASDSGRFSGQGWGRSCPLSPELVA